MKKVTDIGEQRIRKHVESNPHVQGPCKCLCCKHTWHGVIEAGADMHGLECPKCGVSKGVMTLFVAPEYILLCESCGGELFYLAEDGTPVCCICGTINDGQ